MFEFFKASKKIKREEDLAEEKLLKDLRKSLSDETPHTTILKNRLRIIDLEDKVAKLEKRKYLKTKKLIDDLHDLEMRFDKISYITAKRLEELDEKCKYIARAIPIILPFTENSKITKPNTKKVKNGK